MIRKGKNFAWITLMFILAIATVITALNALLPTVNAVGNWLAVDPLSYTGTELHEEFQVKINVSATNMYGYAFSLFWNQTLLNVTHVEKTLPSEWGGNCKDFGDGLIWNFSDPGNLRGELWRGYNNYGAYISAVTAFVPATEINGTWTVATLNFTVMHKPYWPEPSGYSLLNLTKTALSRKAGVPISHDTYTGEYRIEQEVWEHDVAILNAEPSANFTVQGEDVNVTVVVQNQGNNNETFDVSVYGNETQVDTTKPVTDLAKTKKENLTFTWDTTGVPVGNYTIKANCTTVSGEEETADNELTDGWIWIVAHDVAVLEVEPEDNEVFQGDPLDINVTVGNLGKHTETFDVTVYGNASGTVVSINETQSVGNLAPGDNQTLTFTWDTTGVDLKKYNITAAAAPVTDEIGPALENNNLTDGYVFVEWNDVAIIDVTANATRVTKGAIVDVNVTAENQGKETINSTVTVYGDCWKFFAGDNKTIKIDKKQPVTNLAPGDNQTLTFTWNTTNVPAYGNWTIRAEATTVGNTSYPEANMENNKYEDGIVYVEYHDIAVTRICPSTNEVNKIWKVDIKVTITNSGSENETFTLAVYYDDTEIENKTVMDLPPGEKVVTIAWDTTGVRFGNYSLKAVASKVPDEINLKNNICTKGTAALPAWVLIKTERLIHPIGAPDENTYNVITLSNSTVSPVPMNFNATIKTLSFNVTGTGGGFCNVTIPKSFMKGDPNWVVYVNNTDITENVQTSSNDTHTSLYFTYELSSTLPVEIVGTWVVPEFPIAMIAPLLIIVTLIAAILAMKMRSAKRRLPPPVN
ncbi:MAG: CARDB domain-containing protein [Thermoproteota archaeon]|nr:CARDB domain-containing protein [Thermoproteota archaeon]